ARPPISRRPWLATTCPARRAPSTRTAGGPNSRKPRAKSRPGVRRPASRTTNPWPRPRSRAGERERPCRGPGREAALPVGAERPRVHRVSRRGVGPPAARRYGHLRAALPGGLPVRAVLADDLAQAGELPRRLLRVRGQRRGRLRRRGLRPADG